MEHCTCQFWQPGEDSEAKIYIGDHHHGIALSSIPITADAKDARASIEAECLSDSSLMRFADVALPWRPGLRQVVTA